MTFSKNHADDYFNIPDILLKEENADMLLAYFVSPSLFLERTLQEMGVPIESLPMEADKLITGYANTFFSLTKLHPDKPIIGFTYRSLQEKLVRSLLDRGMPIYQDPERAARSIAAVLQYYKMRCGMTGLDC